MAIVKCKHDNGYEVSYYLDKNIKEKILDKAIDVVHNKNNSFVSVIDGKSGVGKSTFGIQVCKYLDPNFTIKNIAWTPKKFLDLINNAKKGDAIMFDEGMIINSRSATSQVNKAIMIALSQIRSRNIFILININSIFDLDKNIALHRADVLFHVYTKDDKVDGEKRIKVYGRQRMKYLYIGGKKYYNYNAPPNFFARPPRKYVFLVNEKVYEETKRRDTVENTEDGEKLNRMEKKYKIALVKLIEYIKENHGILHKDIFDVIGSSESQISKMITWAKDNGTI